MHVSRVGDGWRIVLGTNVSNAPRVIYTEESDDGRLMAFIERQLRLMDLHLVRYGEVNLREGYLCGPPDTSCDCT